jgi:hypothetical protein
MTSVGGIFPALIAALGETVGAAAAGAFVGRKLAGCPRVLRRILPASAVALAAGAVLLGCPLPLRAWDLATAAVAMTAGAVAASRLRTLRALLPGRALVASVAGTLLLLEVGARLIGVDVPGFDFIPDDEAGVWMPGSPSGRDDADPDVPYTAWNLGENNRACNLIFAESYPRTAADLARQAAGAEHVVLHVGDSLVWQVADTRQAADRFTSRLPAAAGWRHVNLARPDTGPDAQYLMVRSWLQQARADVVVWYFDVENDLTDIGMPFACCGFGPLLDLDGGEARPACPTPGWPSCARLWAANSGPPAFLRLLGRVSVFAAWTAHLVYDHPSHDGSPAVALEPARRDRLRIVLGAMRDLVAAHGGRLVVTVMPDLDLLQEAPSPDRIPVDRPNWGPVAVWIRQAAADAGIPYVDLWKPFSRFLASDGPESLFGSPGQPRDRHFTARGHGVLAAILAPALAPFVAAADSAPAREDPAP